MFDPRDPAGIRRLHDWRCFDLDVGRDHRVAIAGFLESYWHVADLPEEEARRSARLKGRGSRVSVAEEAGTMAAVNATRELRIYKWDGGELPIPPALTGTPIQSAAVHPEGGAIAALHTGRRGIVVCALPSGEEIGFRPTERKMPPLALPEPFPLESIALDASGRHCAGFGGGSQLQVWDLRVLRRKLTELGIPTPPGHLTPGEDGKP